MSAKKLSLTDFTFLQFIGSLICHLSNWQRLFIISLNCVFILMLALFFDWQTQLEKLERIKKDIQQVSQQFTVKQHAVNNLAMQKKQFTDLKKKIYRWQSESMSECQSVQILENLHHIAQENHLQIHSLKPLPDQRQAYWLIKSISLNAQGSYHQLAQFIAQIAILPGLVVPQELVLQRLPSHVTDSKSLDANNYLLLDITLKNYFYEKFSSSKKRC